MRSSRKIEQLPPYLFAEIDKKIEQKRAEGIDVIGFGEGDPDLPTPAPIVDRLIEEAGKAIKIGEGDVLHYCLAQHQTRLFSILRHQTDAVSHGLPGRFNRNFLIMEEYLPFGDFTVFPKEGGNQFRSSRSHESRYPQDLSLF